jgi:hypothetical protein
MEGQGGGEAQGVADPQKNNIEPCLGNIFVWNYNIFKRCTRMKIFIFYLDNFGSLCIS